MTRINDLRITTPSHNKLWDTRIITKFLFFPKTILGETRWWIKTSWKQKFESYHGQYCILANSNEIIERTPYIDYNWVNQYWID